jgi:hypothetical protein
MNKIDKLHERLPDKPMKLPHGHKPATPKQIAILEKYDLKHLNSISKNEACIMIAAIFGKKNSDPWIIKNGRHEGKHISLLPWPYRNWVMKNYPDSEVGKLLYAWGNRT